MVCSRDFSEKISLGRACLNLQAQEIAPRAEHDCEILKKPGRPDSFQIVSPREVPKRNFSDAQSRAHFLHALANIELLAIELPALCLLRFGSRNLSFIQRQLQIISEEAMHFSLLQNRLQALGFDFGTLPCHNGLWDYAWRCQNELEHQIVIPCYLEARGLDVTPNFIKKFKDIGDEDSAQAIQIILKDEIGHVQAGQDYLESQAQLLNSTPDELFTSTLQRFFSDQIKSKVKLNKEYRREAGFSENMLKLLE